MKFLNTIFFAIFFISLLSAQIPTGFNVEDIPNEPNTFKVSIEFDADAAGPVITFNGNIAILIPKEYEGANVSVLNGGSWIVNQLIPNAALASFCPGVAGDFQAIVFANTGNEDNLGSISANVPEDLFIAELTGMPPALASDVIQLFDPTGGDPLSACLLIAGLDNALSFDLDGNGGPIEAGAQSNIPAGMIGGTFSLPVELTYFEASRYNDNSATLEWEAAMELDFSHYELERSMDGRTWNNIAKVQGAALNTFGAEYSYLDSNIPLPRATATNVYYRLKMVDNNGTFEYSDIRTVGFESQGVEVEVYPNPTANVIRVDSEFPVTHVSVFDVDGKLVIDQDYLDSEIDLKQMTSGLYRVVITTEAGQYVKTIVKIN